MNLVAIQAAFEQNNVRMASMRVSWRANPKGAAASYPGNLLANIVAHQKLTKFLRRCVQSGFLIVLLLSCTCSINLARELHPYSILFLCPNLVASFSRLFPSPPFLHPLSIASELFVSRAVVPEVAQLLIKACNWCCTCPPHDFPGPSLYVAQALCEFFHAPNRSFLILLDLALH